MSNHLAIAHVTHALQMHLARAFARAGFEAEVKVGVPWADHGESEAPFVNVFLYDILPNGARRNDDLATRTPRGPAALLQAPVAALDLRYLLTFFGQARNAEPERLAAVTHLAIHANPVLSKPLLRTVAQASDSDTHPYLADADLDRQPDGIRLTPLWLSTEELSKVWSVFFNSKYRLSMALQASAVLLDEGKAPAPALPVGQVSIGGRPGGPPELLWAGGAAGADTAVVAGADLNLGVEGLPPGKVHVRAGEFAAEAAYKGGALRIPLPGAGSALRAGIHAVRVAAGPVPAPGARLPESSNALPVALRPALVARAALPGPSLPGAPAPAPIPPVRFLAVPGPTAGSVQRRLEAGFVPPAGPRQDVALLLNTHAASGGTPRSYRLPAPRRDAPTEVLQFDAKEVAPGTYVVRLEVDGADSLLAKDPQGRYDSPKVVVPP